jgi:ParB/RepB/Spo0J family partition protein
LFVPIAHIAVLHNDRSYFDAEAITTLANSINARGLDNAITVRKLSEPQNGKFYELIAGERRLRACQQLASQMIRARIIDVDDQNADLIRIEENLLRRDLNEIELAKALQRYLERHGETQAAVGKHFDMTQAQVSNLLRLLTLPDYWQQQIASAHIPHTIARDVLLPWVSKPPMLTRLIEPFDAALAAGQPLDRQQLQNCLQRIEAIWRQQLNDEVVEPHELTRQDTTSEHAKGKIVGRRIQIKPDSEKPTLPKSRKNPATVKPISDCDEPRLQRELCGQLLAVFVRVLNVKRHKHALPLLAFFSCSYREPAEALFDDDHFPTEFEILDTLSSKSTEQAQFFYDVVVEWTRHATHGCDNPAVIVRMGQFLPIDLLHDWHPTEEILDCFSDDQLQAFAHDHEIEWDQPRKSLIQCLFDVWPAGYCPVEVLKACGKVQSTGGRHG